MYAMPLAKQDEQFLHIEELIEAKRRMLLDKQKKLKFISKQNQFLDVVKDDYTKYYNYISKQKQEQIKALEILNSYIRDLTTSGKLTKHNIDDANFEQNKILHEIKSIRKGLDSIMENSNTINTELDKKAAVKL
jgi:cell division septum initiation protein DivIVA